jgi:3-mercaptopyruvate sulfurtransferase SseA
MYDSGPQCPASRMICRILKARGYERVRCYAGGLEEWADIGYPLASEEVFDREGNTASKEAKGDIRVLGRC